MDFPINSMVIFHSFLYVYQRVACSEVALLDDVGVEPDPHSVSDFSASLRAEKTVKCKAPNIPASQRTEFSLSSFVMFYHDQLPSFCIVNLLLPCIKIKWCFKASLPELCWSPASVGGPGRPWMESCGKKIEQSFYKWRYPEQNHPL